MNVASLELCKELYELSGWHDQQWWHNYDGRTYKPDGTTDYKWYIEPRMLRFESQPVHTSVPAYDLGYLLRKLPQTVPNDDNGGSYYFDLHFVPHEDAGSWTACYDNAFGDVYKYDAFANTPEDTVAKLAIELFKQGILKKEPQSAE